jgi:hypothetical protein
MYIHVSKCKNDEMKERKENEYLINSKEIYIEIIIRRAEIIFLKNRKPGLEVVDYSYYPSYSGV